MLRSAPVRGRIRVLAPSVALAYFLVLGGTPIGEQIGVLRVINTFLGAIIVVVYVRQAPTRFDRIDVAALAAVLLAAISALASPFPRQALDALTAILAYAAIFYVARDLVHRPKVGRMVIWTMRGFSLAITIYAASSYLPQYLEWMVLTGGEILPPIGLPFVARPWGHAYDMTTLELCCCRAGSCRRGRDRWFGSVSQRECCSHSSSSSSAPERNGSPLSYRP